MKKTLLYCVLLVLFLSVPAMASDDNYSTRFDALCKLPDITVTIPATTEVFINPYEIPASLEADFSTAQVISTPSAIENKSEVPLNVTVSVLGIIREGSDMGLSSTSTGGTGTSKRAFIYFEMLASDTAAPAQSGWASAYDAEKHLYLSTRGIRTKRNMVTIDAADGENPFGAFRLAGDCAAEPRSEWTENDGIYAEIAFTFTPLPRPAT